MKKLPSIVIVLVTLIATTGFYGYHTEKQAATFNSQSIEGTWRLISYKYGEEDFFSEVPNFMEYRKVLTKTHYSWVSYGENGDDIIGAGGGTYTVQGDKYIEKINYFHPHNQDLIGSSTTFQSELKGNIWSISGTIRSIKINPQTKEKEEIVETSLSEVWERVE